MKALDPAETAQLLEHFRPTRMFIPVLLGVLCGLRRGEVTALKWSAVHLAGAQLSIVESTEQTRAGIRQKETKSGRARTVALLNLGNASGAVGPRKPAGIIGPDGVEATADEGCDLSGTGIRRGSRW